MMLKGGSKRRVEKSSGKSKQERKIHFYQGNCFFHLSDKVKTFFILCTNTRKEKGVSCPDLAQVFLHILLSSLQIKLSPFLDITLFKNLYTLSFFS